MKIKINVFFTALVLLVPVFILAQGVISGTVTDEEGKAIIGANVYLEGTTLGTATNMNGGFSIVGAQPGDYTIIVSAIGYKTLKTSLEFGDENVIFNSALKSDVLGMDATVVLGTPGGAGMRKQDASFAINTVSELEIREFSPSSTANLLELVPGVWSESSGGIAGANIFVRGLPSSGDAPFVTMSINGGPIYGVETLSFFEQSTIFRIDETVESTEAVRGGPSAVFSNAEPGMTVNFNLKKGGEVTQGRVKYETSDYSLQRLDGYLSGKITEGLYYMFGGYVSTSPGIRNTQFNSENGKQFTAHITKVFSGGVIDAFTRYTDDYGQWVLPMALETGNDLGTFSPLGNATRFRTLQVNTNGDSVTYDFAKGRGWTGTVSGLKATFDLGNDWMVRNNLTYTAGDANTFGLVPNGNAIKVSALGRDVSTRGGVKLAGSDYIQNYGHWVVLKNLSSINNDFSVNKKWTSHDLTLGLYQARWSSVDFWTLGNHVPVHNTENGDLLESGITADTLAAHGAGGSWNYGLQYAGDARVLAVYGADSWNVLTNLRLDLGVRYEFFNLQYTLDHGGHPDGVIDMAKDLTGKDLAVTAAVNYDLTKQLGVFGRYSDSYIFPHFDMVREGQWSIVDKENENEIAANQFMQVEFGAKYDSRLFSLFATGFFNSVEVFDGDVGAVRESALLGTQTMGLELDGAVTLGDLTVRAIGTVQDGEITDSKTSALVGKKIWRQPALQVRVAPSYKLTFGKSTATIYGAARTSGKRWDSRDNNFELDGYTKIDAGAVIVNPSGISFRIHGDNLTDSEGLTEGDPRDPSSANGRPIFGRSIKCSVSYDF